jgi:hypothetical protein
MRHSIIIFFLVSISSIIYAQTQIGQDIYGEYAGDAIGGNNRVSLSSNGNILAIGTSINEDGGLAAGHIRVFENINGSWTQIGNDIDGLHEFDGVGSRIDLSADGSIVATGTRGNDGSGNRGGIRVYQNQSGVWTQLGSEVYGRNIGGGKVDALSLSSNGHVFAFGDKGHPIYEPVSYVGVYKYESGNWVQFGDYIEAEDLTDLSGASVSLSSDGTIVAIGAPFNKAESSNSSIGHVRVFENQSGVWTQLGNDIDGEAIGYESGWSISLSADGTVVAIGAPNNGGNGIQAGHVRVYKYESGNWLQVGDDIDGEVAYDKTGQSLSLSGNGKILAIGERGNIAGSTEMGRVRIFIDENDTWVQIGNSIFGDESEDYSGQGVTLSTDATTLAIGATGNDGNGDNSGQVRIYDISTLLSTNEVSLPKISLFPNPAKQQFTIQLQDGLQLKKVTIYDSLGKLFKVVNANVISTLELSSGIYFIEIITNKGKATKKLVVD